MELEIIYLSVKKMNYIKYYRGRFLQESQRQLSCAAILSLVIILLHLFISADSFSISQFLFPCIFNTLIEVGFFLNGDPYFEKLILECIIRDHGMHQHQQYLFFVNLICTICIAYENMGIRIEYAS